MLVVMCQPYRIEGCMSILYFARACPSALDSREGQDQGILTLQSNALKH